MGQRGGPLAGFRVGPGADRQHDLLEEPVVAPSRPGAPDLDAEPPLGIVLQVHQVRWLGVELRRPRRPRRADQAGAVVEVDPLVPHRVEVGEDERVVVEVLEGVPPGVKHVVGPEAVDGHRLSVVPGLEPFLRERLRPRHAAGLVGPRCPNEEQAELHVTFPADLREPLVPDLASLRCIP